jgi:hypothetical protein
MGGLSADPGPDDGRRLLRKPLVERDRGRRDGFARRHHRELRHAIQGHDLAIVEMRLRLEAFDLGDDLLQQLIRRHQRDGADSAHALEQARPIRGGAVSDRRYGAKAGDDDAVHAIHVLLATSVWIARTMSPTVTNSGPTLLAL